MNKLKRILVATDFSDHSQFAVLRAVELAKATKAHLTILHIAKKGFLEKMVDKVVPVLGKVLITPEEHAASLLKKQVKKISKNKINV
jgi:nucleotide-binding universal stress UspA family protein